MKKVLAVLVLSSLVSLNVYASEEEHHMGEKTEKNNFYIAVKGMSTLGDSIEEGSSTLEGSTGVGIGVDVGYKLPYGFSVEIDATYAENTVTETLSNGDSEEFDASYITTSLDVDYKYHLTHEIGLIVKVGYEYEIETIDGLNIDNSSTGFIFAGAVEYEVSEHVALLGEYEATTIEGPRGNSIFAGIVYDF